MYDLSVMYDNFSDSFAEKWSGNYTNYTPFQDLPMDSSFLLLLSSLILALVWVIYITYYNSRVAGYIITKLVNRLCIKTGYFKIGSFTVNALSGKIMFRDVIYGTEDYTIRVQDGYLIFRWWRSYVPKDVSEDLSHSDTRLSVVLNGFELHVYNRSDLYASLERTFGLETNFSNKSKHPDKDQLNHENEVLNFENQRDQLKPKKARPEAALAKTWRDLIPVIKLDMCSGRLVFGNRLVPTTLSINVEEAHFVYSTKPAASSLDHFMHFAKCKAENFKVILAPSLKYTGMIDEPPRYMGEGFVVMSSNNIDVYMYMDEPGIVPEEPVLLRLANGDIVEAAPPMWGMDIKCGKGTDFSYGPWADRQRDNLFRFFFPSDYQPLKVTKSPKPGDKRAMQSFDIRLMTLSEATVDILFSKEKETNAVHVNIGPGSYLEVTLPWIVLQDGYTTKITGQLLHLEATTSLQYRSLIESETLEYTVKCHYPIRWNDHQEWILNLTGCKATANLIYSHKDFFQDLINDWASKARPDLLNFVPYTWKISILLKEFELITISNEYNWIDCTSQNQENCHLAFCGDVFDMSFDLPFVDFLPQTIPLRFWIQGESVDLTMYTPEVFTSRNIILALDKNAKVLARDGTLTKRPEVRKWRNVCQKSQGWVDCWSVPIVALCINYIYHPIPPMGPVPQADIPTPDKEELLLSPMRFPHKMPRKLSHNMHWTPQDSSQKFDPEVLPPDKVSLELEIGPSVLYLYGTMLRGLLNLKENIFGDDQAFTDMQQSKFAEHTNNNSIDNRNESSVNEESDSLRSLFDPRNYRPLDVQVQITMHDIQAHLMKNCTESDPPCPVILLERFGVEMKKTYKQTELQVLLSPSMLLVSDNAVRPSKEQHLRQGHLTLSALQIRGHAMFSDEGRSLDEETLEYAWMIEIQLGKLSGRITMPQLYHIATSLETLVLLALNSENTLKPPRPPKLCLHGLPPLQCPNSDSESRYQCPSADEIKYKMTRVAIDAIDLTIVENGTALQAWVSPVRLSTCNLHGQHVKSGITCVLPMILFKQFVSAGSHFSNLHSNTNTSTSSKSNQTLRDRAASEITDNWLEIGSINVGPVIVESALSLSTSESNLHMVQNKYLKSHDEKTKRLWFLWAGDPTVNKLVGKCGCIGGCAFFGNNRNGPKFFKPSKSDIQDGINIAAFRIQEPGKDPGFGQSIIHEGQLVFHTPPYSLQDVSLHEVGVLTKGAFEKLLESPRIKSAFDRKDKDGLNRSNTREVIDTITKSSATSTSPLCFAAENRNSARRFSYTSSRSNQPLVLKDVPYARLMDCSPTTALPLKLDSDSKLHFDKSKSILNVPESDVAPKNSASDSKLAVDYFNSPDTEIIDIIQPSSMPTTSSEFSPQPNIKSVNISESHHSLHARIGSEEKLKYEVQRTISMSSENHSEAFFSADEEVTGSSSRASSLKRSAIGTGTVLRRKDSTHQRKKFASDLSIGLDKKTYPAVEKTFSNIDNIKIPDVVNHHRLSSHRSDHEIHTPEHRSGGGLLNGCSNHSVHMQRRFNNISSSFRSGSPHLYGGTTNHQLNNNGGDSLHDVFETHGQDNILIDSSDTHSMSSTSFISAVSSQEDMTLVNLHMQVNKPIIDSPLLMSSYVSHLSQVRCSNWNQASLPFGADAFTTPLFQRTEDGRLVYIGGRYIPRFETISEGFTSLKMVNRTEMMYPTSPPTGNKTPTHPYTWTNQSCLDKEFDTEYEMGSPDEDELLATTNQSGSRRTVVVKLKGDVDIMVTPVVLESLQRFVDALTPTLSKLHPLTVINHLHSECINQVEAANILKQDQSLSYWSQIQSSKTSTAERNITGLNSQGNIQSLQTSIYEESISTEIQGTIVLPKVNITMLQASVVEEIISFSALDNIKDLTCVSLFAVCFDSITIRFHDAKQVREIVQTFHHPSVLPATNKKTIISNLVSMGSGTKNTLLTKEPAGYRASAGSRTSNSGMNRQSGIDNHNFMSRANKVSVDKSDNGNKLENSFKGDGGGSVTSGAGLSLDAGEISEIAGISEKYCSMGNVVVGGGNTGIGPNRPSVISSKSTASSAHSKGKALLAAVVTRTGLRGVKRDTLGSEPVFIETQERQHEETVVTLNIGKIHSQLRRLRNESTILKDACITAIPEHFSKVLFTCARIATPLRSMDYYIYTHDGAKSNQTNGNTSDQQFCSNIAEEKLGFIMFECGLEGVSLKVVKRIQFEKKDNQDDDKPRASSAPRTDTEGNLSKIREESSNAESMNRNNKASDKFTQNISSVDSSSTTTIKNSGDGSQQTGESDSIGFHNSSSTIKDMPNNNSSNRQGVVSVKDKGNISSCFIELKTVWFNFAAPPRAPITRKLDFTRLDWNLLSTASPAINAWLSPSNRFAIRVVHMYRSFYRRTTGIVACLMAEALDVQGIHMPIKSRYNRLTPLAKTLKEDPSCQLCSILQKYVLQSDMNVIELNLRETDLPMLSTLRQGVIVLSRQWKNVLYTPLLLEHNYKTKFTKPLNVTFAVPEVDEPGYTDGENSAEDNEPNDECAVLLNTQHSTIQHPSSSRLSSLKPDDNQSPGPPVNSPRTINNPVAVVIGGVENVLTSPSPPSVPFRKHKSLQPTQVPSSSRASIVFPLLSGGNPFSQRRSHDEENTIGYGTLKEEKLPHINLNHVNSNPSIYSVSQHSTTSGEHFSPKSSTTNTNLPGGSTNKISAKHGSSEDLYSWMAKQQDYIRDKLRRDPKKDKVEEVVNVQQATASVPTNAGHYSLLYPMQDSLKLLDAHIIFQPLLSCLGVMPEQMISNVSGNNTVSSLDSLGSNLSLVGGIDTMRIDIVVSQEHGNGRRQTKGQGKNKSGKFVLDIPSETPAFLCERIGLELDLNKMADMTVDDMIQKQNILYISRGQLKKHTSTVLNVNLNIRYISQQVNMPLLRLLHQFTNMYQNVKDTQLELKEQHPESKRNHNMHDSVNKNESSSISDVQTLVENKLNLKVSDPISIISHSRPTISPSPSIRSRPQSFAQKLRQTGKSVKGYMNLSDGGTSPILPNSPSGSALDHLTISSDKSIKDTAVFSLTPKCWKTVYYLLDLYATMPETKTITHRFSVAHESIDGVKGHKQYIRKPDPPADNSFIEDSEKGEHRTTTPLSHSTQLNVLTGERTRFIVFGVARIHRTRLLATLSGLKLEAEITSLHSSLTCRKKTKPASIECSLTGQVGRTMIVLLEGVAPNQQTVVKITVGKSQALYSTITRRGKYKNSGLLTVGAINIDIPQHPVALHDMMTRGSKQLSSTLQELRVTRTSSRMSRGMPLDEESPHHFRCSTATTTHTINPSSMASSGNVFEKPVRVPQHEDSVLLQPLVMQFSIILQSLSITAALLPSLQAQYKMDQVNSTGVTGSKAKFTIDLPQHSLSFTTKLQVTEANLPSEASIELPKVHVSAEYIQQDSANHLEHSRFTEGIVLRQGSYMSATADIGVFEHSLTTDLLNHLVFVQKVFMKEVNEVVQKVYGAEKPVPIWLDDASSVSTSTTRILFSLMIRIKRIQLTATTPTNSAVRLETGAVELELSNRVQNVSGSGMNSTASGDIDSHVNSMKLFGRAKVDINLSLGQLIKNPLFEEAEPEFQQFAFFNTRIELRNAFQDEMVEGNDKELILITLKRPLIYIQPLAVDKAILVWLNYKNAYEYWNEKRANLNKEVLTATQQVFEKVPFGQLTSQLSAPHLGTLFLQLTVEDMGICLPLNPLPLNSWGQRSMFDSESRAAVVITLERTSISACSSGSLVSKAGFVGLCLRFADDFETSLDEWKPDMNDSTFMNYCVVSEGTYEICSRTIAAKPGTTENAKWILNVSWKMEGVDIHLDVNVGKQLSALGHTLTMLTGAEEDETINMDDDSDEGDQGDGSKASQESILPRSSRRWTDNLPAFIFDQSLDAKKRSKLIEKEMNEQAKIINDLRSLGASHGTIQQEMKKLHELETMVFKDFRRDMIQKLRRKQSSKATSIKEKFGLGSSKASTYRSRSFIVPSPTPEHQLESPEDQPISGNSASFESSPRSGPSRSASLRVKTGGQPKVTFSDTHTICRQSSLPSAGSELSLPEDELQWVDHINIDGERVEIRKKIPIYGSLLADDIIDSSVPLLDSFSKEQQASTTVYGGNYTTGNTSSTQQPIQMTYKPQEPNIDFELDVKVLINSGKCVLHTKDAVREEEMKLSARMRKERSSSSAGIPDWTSPASPGPSRPFPSTRSGGDRNPQFNQQHWSGGSNSRHGVSGTYGSNQPSPPTIFHIPAMDIRVHYTSTTTNPPEKNLSETVQGSRYSYVQGSDYMSNLSRKLGMKKASLFVWMTLQSIPEETIISPTILEFLEHTLEPIPSKSSFPSIGGMSSSLDNEPMAYGNYVYASFPVDVIVYFHMQPSTFRFSCLPVSRVECMLQLPSLDIVFSSKRAEEELNHEYGEGVHSFSAATAIGGLSVTGCLADFSVYIFHPYGGQKKSHLKETQWSPLSDSERKDSLSINVEFVKFHVSRSRKLNFQSDVGAKIGKGAGDQSRACIRFSTIVDIGSASFKYDMRRLTEILAFPRAWYRRSIVRRLFLGDLSLAADSHNSSNSALDPPWGNNEMGNSDIPEGSSARYSTGNGRSDKSPLLRDKLKLNLDQERQSRIKENGRASSFETNESTDSISPTDIPNPTTWETLVLFAINFTKLNVHMNMGNVMGNVTWQTKDFRSEGRLSIGSTGRKNMFVKLGLVGSSLDAKGGIVGGTIELANIDTYIHFREEPSQEPDHTVGLKLLALELRLDYMGTSVLMARVSALEVTLRDEWKLVRKSSIPVDAFMPTRRPAVIFMHGDLGWDQLQIMISKSTTVDLVKMFNKLEEFFSQQFKSSKRVFSSLQPRTHSRGSGHSFKRKLNQQHKKKSTESRDAWSTQLQQSLLQDAKHHRHWQNVLASVAGLHLPTLKLPLPNSGTVLGGTMELHGRNISLACFHGINFKTKSWALFSLKDPCISFETEAQEIPSAKASDELDVHIVQTLTFSLGMNDDHPTAQHESMATVCRMSRNIIFPPQFKSLQEWFHYAFINSDIDAVDRFPSLEREKLEVSGTNSIERSRNSSSSTGKLQDPNHTREVIFALPTLQLHLKTEHLQTASTPESLDDKPIVECSFVTEFEDHIFVTVDAEAFFFLHDLITSYVKEKERSGMSQSGTQIRSQSPDPRSIQSGNKSSSQPSNSSQSTSSTSTAVSDEERKKKAFTPAEVFNKDWRNYHCKTWHLEPTVRLLSWAGKSIEPYGIDYILQKLGFSHARTTIPKWMQRGFMDPLDKVLAVLMLRMVSNGKLQMNKIQLE